MPKSVEQWSLRTLRDKLIKIGAKLVSHSHYMIFQMAEVAVPQTLFREILDQIGQLRASPELARVTCVLMSFRQVLNHVRASESGRKKKKEVHFQAKKGGLPALFENM